jgi:hypothetical protein
LLAPLDSGFSEMPVILPRRTPRTRLALRSEPDGVIRLDV